MEYITSSLNVFVDKTTDFIKNISINNTKEKKRIFEIIPFFSQLQWFYSEPTYIIDNIFIGSSINASQYNFLVDRDIKMIINMTHEISNYYPDDFIYYKFGLYDNNEESIKKYLIDAYDNIIDFQTKNKDKYILIHCFMGASRSASVVIYYLMKKHNYRLNEAILYCKGKRELINISELFYKELYELELETLQ